MGEEETHHHYSSWGTSALIAAATAKVVAVLATYLLEALTSLDGVAAAVPVLLGIAAGVAVGKQHARRRGGTPGHR